MKDKTENESIGNKVKMKLKKPQIIVLMLVAVLVMGSLGRCRDPHAIQSVSTDSLQSNRWEKSLMRHSFAYPADAAIAGCPGTKSRDHHCPVQYPQSRMRYLVRDAVDPEQAYHDAEKNVGFLVHREAMIPAGIGGGKWGLDISQLKSEERGEERVCEHDSLAKEWALKGNFGSTVTYIGDGHVLASLHAISESRDTALVAEVVQRMCVFFDFIYQGKKEAGDAPPSEFDDHRVFHCKKLVRSGGSVNAKWAILKLDRVPEGLNGLSIYLESKEFTDSCGYYYIGHPLMGPKVISDGGCKDLEESGALHPHLRFNCFDGASGAPVFNSNDQWIGIINKGDSDYDWELHPDSNCSTGRTMYGGRGQGIEVVPILEVLQKH